MARRTLVSTRRLAPAALALLTVVAASCSTTEPKPVCSARRDAFAARYTVVSKSGACPMDLPLSEELEVQSYVPDPNKASDHRKFAIEPPGIADAIAAGEGVMPPVED